MMKNIQVLAYMIFAFLLLSASQSHFSIALRIPAIETGKFFSVFFWGPNLSFFDYDLKISTARQTQNPSNRFSLAWVKDNMRKVPSAPNPSGNRHPPSKP
ncbi:uncharacterized protein [Gossypium hirsutum]|uniref:Uncharacterized protein n=1 Tax=Gossypium hirsutum TaxID=3635 RepID=A0ABM3A9N4_GOSHI|nr:uncharacterized protein LOC107899820 [Gossypium hirsutum]